MKKLFGLLLPVVMLLAIPAIVSADFLGSVDLGGELNTVKFNNREQYMRKIDGVWTPITVGNLANDVQEGDVLVAIYSGTSLYVGTDPNAQWNSGSGDYFLAYSAQKVVSTLFVGNIGGISYGNVDEDPFGVLSAGNMMNMYLAGANYQTQTGVGLAALQSSVDSVTVGTALLASFGMAGVDDFAELGVSLAGRVAAYGLSNTFTSAPISFIPDDYLDNGNTTDVAGIAAVFTNGNYGTSSPWQYTSSDPFFFRAVPEPGTFALWGSCLAIGAFVALRRRK